jgi:hypothetical protein
LIVVGILAIAALALSLYAAFFRSPADASASSSQVAVSSTDIEKRLTALEQSVAARELHSPAPAAAPGPAVSRENTGDGRFEVVANAELKGRLGRLVVEFPTADKLKAHVEAFKSGDAQSLRTEYGNVSAEMTAGAYDLEIGGAIVANVPVKSGHDTRVHVGVLRLNATGNTHFEIYPPGGTNSLGTYYGQNDVGLPVGTFEVEVNGQRERVAIASGAIAEF